MENYILKKDFLDLNFYPSEPIFDLEPIIQTRKNHKGIIVLFYSKGQVNAEKEFLKKILSAIHLDYDKDIVPINITSKNELRFSQIDNKISCKSLLVFGISTTELGLVFQCTPYQFFKFRAIHCLFADELSKIQEDQSLKKQLWIALKNQFNPSRS